MLFFFCCEVKRFSSGDPVLLFGIPFLWSAALGKANFGEEKHRSRRRRAGVRYKLISPQTHDSYRVPNTMRIIHWPTTEPLTVWHLHFICILESGWFRSHISFFDKLPCQKWGRFAFSLSRSDSGCVAREAAPSGDGKPFVTDDWVNRLVLINILIGALPPWTFGFLLFAQLSPVVSALFWLRASCVCFSTSTQRHAWLELCKGWFNGGPGWIDRRCLASPRDDLHSYHPESTEIPNVQPPGTLCNISHDCGWVRWYLWPGLFHERVNHRLWLL